MKNSLVGFCFAVPALSALFFTSCCTDAGVHVSHTDVATGATNPKAIYIRPFSVAYTRFRSDLRKRGAAPIQESLAPKEFANDLQEELCKIAPAMVIQKDEMPRTGWLVDGHFDVIDSGNYHLRGSTTGFSGAGHSHIVMHVRVTDFGGNGLYGTAFDPKEGIYPTSAIRTEQGYVIYEFDLEGGSGRTGPMGTSTAPGRGDAIPFDFRNSAEQVMLALTPDPFRYGYRNSPEQRE